MTVEEFFEEMHPGFEVKGGSPAHEVMHALSQRALRITMDLNSHYHTHEEIVALMSQLTGRPVDESFGLFPPFSMDCGMNIHLGSHVFINAGCRLQDQGGIYIDDGAFLGHDVVLATINHSEDPEHRADMTFAPIHIGKNVWVGSKSVILPGVTVGDGAIIAAGAVVSKDVPANMIVGGVPARVLRPVKAGDRS